MCRRAQTATHPASLRGFRLVLSCPHTHLDGVITCWKTIAMERFVVVVVLLLLDVRYLFGPTSPVISVLRYAPSHVSRLGSPRSSVRVVVCSPTFICSMIRFPLIPTGYQIHDSLELPERYFLLRATVRQVPVCRLRAALTLVCTGFGLALSVFVSDVKAHRNKAAASCFPWSRAPAWSAVNAMTFNVRSIILTSVPVSASVFALGSSFLILTAVP